MAKQPSFKPKKKLRLRLIIPPLIFVIACIYAFSKTPSLLQHNTEKAIQALGFYAPILPQPEISFSQITYSNIQLDSQGVNTIKKLTANLSPAGLFSGRFNSLNIEGLELIASLDENNNIILDDWKAPQENSWTIPAQNIQIKAAELSLLTHIQGLITLQLNLVAQPHESGKLSFQSDFKSQQKYLSLQGNANGVIAPHYINSDIEILRGKLNWQTQNIRMTRMNGWANITMQPNDLSILSELRSGGLTLGETPWQNASATFKKEGDNQEFYLSAKSIGIDGLELSISDNNGQSNKVIYAPSEEVWKEYSALHHITMQELMQLGTTVKSGEQSN